MKLRNLCSTNSSELRIERNDSIDDIIQDIIPEYSNYKESFVETTQGPFSELPEASTYTKYLMTQYRADPAKKTSISVTMSMTPVNEGCAHFTCNAPATTPGGTTNNADGSTTTTSYTMSSLLGPGCKSWTINGDMTIFHDLVLEQRKMLLQQVKRSVIHYTIT